MRSARPLHGLDGRERAEGRVAVVLGAAAVEAIAGESDERTIEAISSPLLRLIERPDCLADLEVNRNPDPERGFSIFRSDNLSVLAVVWRPGSRTVSIERPSMGRPRPHSSMRAAARSMWPWLDQSGSKAGDLAGISM